MSARQARKETPMKPLDWVMLCRCMGTVGTRILEPSGLLMPVGPMFFAKTDLQIE